MSTTKVRELTFANVNLDDPQEREEFARQEQERAGERVRAEVKRLQEMGILDAQGRRIRTDTPPDMLPGSETDFGG